MAVGRDGRVERRLGDRAGRRGGQHRRQRGVVEAAVVDIVGAGGDQQRTAIADIAGDVVEVEDRQHAAMLVAIEDDEVELVDLLREQLAGGEGDQRELVDRRAVLLLRRAQDGEVDEVDRGVGLEEVPPGALAGMRLARDEEDAEVLADALDRGDGAVVDLGQLAGQRLGLEFEDIGAAMGDVDGEFLLLAGGHQFARQRVAVTGDIDADAGAGHRPAPSSRTRKRTVWLSPTMPKRGALVDDQPAVDLVVMAGEKDVDGSGIAEGRRPSRRHVMDLAVGEHHHRAEPLGRHIGRARRRAGRTASCRRPCRRARRHRRRAPRHCGTRQGGPRARPWRRRSSRRGRRAIWLALSSVTRATTVGSGSRSSRSATGLRSARNRQRHRRGAQPRAALAPE